MAWFDNPPTLTDEQIAFAQNLHAVQHALAKGFVLPPNEHEIALEKEAKEREEAERKDRDGWEDENQRIARENARTNSPGGPAGPGGVPGADISGSGLYDPKSSQAGVGYVPRPQDQATWGPGERGFGTASAHGTHGDGLLMNQDQKSFEGIPAPDAPVGPGAANWRGEGEPLRAGDAVTLDAVPPVDPDEDQTGDQPISPVAPPPPPPVPPNLAE